MALLDETQAAALLSALGLPDDTSDPEFVVAAAADMSRQAGENEPSASAVVAAAKKQGLDTIDTDTLTALRAEAIEGRQIKAAAAAAKVEASVDEAINKGKITPARRKHWVNLITADPGMAEVLASVPDEMAVPLTEIGHGVSAVDGPGKRDGWFY